MAARLPKLVRELGFARSAVMGRFVKATSKLMHELMAPGGGQLSASVKNSSGLWEKTLLWITLRVTMDSKESGAPAPVRVYSDATGGGGLASLTLLSRPERRDPVLSYTEKLHAFELSRASCRNFSDPMCAMGQEGNFVRERRSCLRSSDKRHG